MSHAISFLQVEMILTTKSFMENGKAEYSQQEFFSHDEPSNLIQISLIMLCHSHYKLSDTEVILFSASFSGVQSKTTVVLGIWGGGGLLGFFCSNMGEIHDISERPYHSKSKLMNYKDSSLYLNSINQLVIIGI